MDVVKSKNQTFSEKNIFQIEITKIGSTSRSNCAPVFTVKNTVMFTKISHFQPKHTFSYQTDQKLPKLAFFTPIFTDFLLKTTGERNFS